MWLKADPYPQFSSHTATNCTYMIHFPVSTNSYRLLYFSVENSTAGAVIVEASLSCSIFMMRQKILYRKEVCPLRYIKVSTDQQYTMYLRPCDVSISSLITVSVSEFHECSVKIGPNCMAVNLLHFFYNGKNRNVKKYAFPNVIFFAI